jgi:hypothetical protein
MGEEPFFNATIILDNTMTPECRNKGCEKEGVQEIRTENEAGWFCDDHWMVAMMLGGKPGERR